MLFVSCLLAWIFFLYSSPKRICPSQLWQLCSSCFCSIAKSCSTLCNPMNCSTSDFPVLYCLVEFDQIHIHWVDDEYHTSHIIVCHSLLLLPSIFPSIRVFCFHSIIICVLIMVVCVCGGLCFLRLWLLLGLSQAPWTVSWDVAFTDVSHFLQMQRWF